MVFSAPEQTNRLESRFELKFSVPVHDQYAVDLVTLLHPAGFQRTYPARWVNSIYFDTPDLHALEENFAGISDRAKYRIRWYGPLAGEHKAQYEIKIRRIFAVPDPIYPSHDCGYDCGPSEIVTVTEDELSTIDAETHSYEIIGLVT